MTITLDRHHRWTAGTLAAGGALAMVPWTAVLANTLPARHTATHWATTWVGFDALLAVSFAMTALAIAGRVRLLRAAPVVTATLLVCDVWFDLTTASRADLAGSLTTAAVSVPLAGWLLVAGYRSLDPARPAGKPTVGSPPDPRGAVAG